MSDHLNPRAAKSFVLACFSVFLLLTSSSCNNEVIDPYVGKWVSEKTRVTVRTEETKGDFQFYTDSAFFELEISADMTASGKLGSATFGQAEIRKNFGSPEITGLTFIVDCGDVGRIFPGDPLEEKEVQFWMSSIENEESEAELRYTEGGSQFPMAFVFFRQ